MHAPISSMRPRWMASGGHGDGGVDAGRIKWGYSLRMGRRDGQIGARSSQLNANPSMGS